MVSWLVNNNMSGHKQELIPNEVIESKIYLIRSQKVMLDRDLATLYGVKTKVLNQAVKRNTKRFPLDFMFQLTEEESGSLRSQFVTLKRGQHRKYLPYVFTEQGIAMLSSVLNSESAIMVNIQIIRTFTKLRKILLTHKDLERKINEIIQVYGGKLKDHDQQIKNIFEAINELLKPPAEKDKKKYGFLADKKR